MPYDEAWHFLQVGRYLERAGTTARILHARGRELQHVHGHSRPEEVHRWLSLLRSVSAYEAYMRMRPGGVQPHVVAEYLLLSQSFPRSVAMGVRRVHEELESIEEELAMRRREGPILLAGALAARLRYTMFGDLGEAGLTPFLGTILDQIDGIGASVRQTYFETGADVAGTA
jgi:uncharacterized alpha-E superfamily protein